MFKLISTCSVAFCLSSLFAANNTKVIDDFLIDLDTISYDYTSSNSQPQKPAKKSTLKKTTRLQAYGDFIYWNTYASDYDWYINNSHPSGIKIDYAPVTFSWDIGFRLGLNYKTSWEALSLDLSWVRFHTESNLSVFNSDALNHAEPSTSITPFMKNQYTYGLGSYYKGNASVKFNLDQVDFFAKIPFKIIDHKFSLIPFGGARAVFFKTQVDQKFLANQNGYFWNDSGPGFYTQNPPQNYYIMNQKDNFWALGLVAGIKGLLSFNHGFSYFLGADAGIVGGSETYSLYEEPVNVGEGQTYEAGMGETSVKKFRAILDFETGLAWDREFGNNSWGLGLKLGYEMHMYFNTPSLLYYYYSGPTVNTTFQGLTAGANLRF
jgi:Legionella pneumophila major outer membrane protein precursor